MVILFGLALLPDRICTHIIRGEIFYVLAHLLCYGSLAFFLCLSLRFQRRIWAVRMGDFNVAWLTLLIMTVFSAFTEWIQRFAAGRKPTIFDFYCDLIGVAVAMLFFYALKHIAFRVRSRAPLAKALLYTD
jgi:VanZ family protein